MAGVTVKLEMSRLNALKGTAPRRADDIVGQSALRILRDAQVSAPVETGQLRGSGTVENTGKARRKIGFSALHALYQEMGTRRNPARPFLKPAFDGEAPSLARKLGKIVD